MPRYTNSFRGWNRRAIGISCIVFSILLCTCAVAYAFTSHASGSPTVIPQIPTQPPITCKTPAHRLGDSTVSITSAGLHRTFVVHLPPAYGKQPLPMIVAYHGYSWTTHIMEVNANMLPESDKAGYVLVLPQGLDSPPSWNAGVGAYGPTGDANDLQFTSDLLSYMNRQYCVDSHRVYVAGFSLGGGMAYRVACTMTDRIAALVTVSGAYYPFGGCHPSRPLPIMEIHGLADNEAPYVGNPAAHMEGVQDYLHGWLEIDGCSLSPTIFFKQGDVTGFQWTHCRAGTMVRHYQISDNGHTWPGTPHTTHIIDGNVVMWQFFQQYSIPAAS